MVAPNAVRMKATIVIPVVHIDNQSRRMFKEDIKAGI